MPFATINGTNIHYEVHGSVYHDITIGKQAQDRVRHLTSNFRESHTGVPAG